MAQKNKAQLIEELQALGVEHDPNATNAELSTLLADATDGEAPVDDDTLGLEAEGDEDEAPAVADDIAGLDEDEDAIDPTVEGSGLDEDDGDDGLSAADAKAYREAHIKQKKAASVGLPKQSELTPHSKKAIYVRENLSCMFGGKRVILVAGKPLPRGVLNRAQIALMLDQKKLATSPPKRKGTRRSLLGLTG